MSIRRFSIFFFFLALPTLADKEGRWDVSSPPGVASSASIDVNRGTWLSLDLSPDGRTIVFDLLGDLYLLDIAGGEARVLTSGLEWDMQPAYSPDGSKIAFTSDRGGADNIWLLDLAKGESSARALSKETFRLLSQPAWDPKGEHLVARKHFTGTRSLGAGEIWAYHLEGGSGVQLTKRKNDQLNLGEPAFSSDGRYLYFSIDTTTGPMFQYNRDPSSGIYAIDRLDRETGDIERVVSGSGGAIRPTPSPDGKLLAFVRRIRGKSVLMLKNLEDGSERALFDGLDRDMQETWAIHGTYPSMAWTADSGELVFWAQGQIWRQSLAPESEPKAIAFRVKGDRELRTALRYPVEVAPGQFPVKAIRKVRYSPAGQAVVFEALGKLWLGKAGGAVKRLTQGNGTESSPHFVSENELLFAHWDDQALGTVRLANLQSGSEQILKDKGRFSDPVLSPDGRYLLYNRQSSDSLFDPRHTFEPGLYLLDLQSKREVRIAETGRQAHFGKNSEHFYFSRGSAPTEFVRHDLNDSKDRVLFSGENVTDFQISPDEKYLAFREGFELYLNPFLPTGRTQTVGADSKELPLQKVSKATGSYFPAWDARGRLSWNVGPRVWTYEPSSKKTLESDLGWSVAYHKPKDSKIALVGGKIVSMKGEQVIEKGVVLIEGDRIAKIGALGEVPLPADVFQIDVSQKTILPGLVDVHWHGSFSDESVFPEVNYMALSALSFGVTTIHDPSNDTASVFTAKEMQMAGFLLAPRIFSTGTILYGAKATGYYAEIDSLDDALGHLNRLKAWGARSVKSYNQPRRDQRQQVLEAARQTQMMVVPEGGSLFEHNMTMVVDGHTGVEHALPVAKIYDDVNDLWAQTAVGYTPTLGVAYGGLWGENYWYVKTDVWDDERLNRFVPREVIDSAARRRTQAPDDEYNHINAAVGAKALADRGVTVNLGAHGQREGLAAHWELWMLVQGGMTAHQALKCGTINGARYLGMDKDIGSLEEGKLADLIVVDGDILSDIRRSKYVDYTLIGGKVYDSSTMKQIGPDAGPEPKLWWRSK